MGNRVYRKCRVLTATNIYYNTINEDLLILLLEEEESEPVEVPACTDLSSIENPIVPCTPSQKGLFCDALHLHKATPLTVENGSPFEF
jgi:hypothetical protein